MKTFAVTFGTHPVSLRVYVQSTDPQYAITQARTDAHTAHPALSPFVEQSWRAGDVFCAALPEDPILEAKRLMNAVYGKGGEATPRTSREIQRLVDSLKKDVHNTADSGEVSPNPPE